MTESHVFQIVNWYTTDIEVEDSDDDVEDEEEGMQNQPREKYVMKLFGVDEQGSSISATVTDFTPHFYVKIHKQWSNFDIQKLSTALRMKMGRSGNGKLEIKCMKKKDFWGFSNNSNFCFLRLCFDTHKAMKIAARVISNGNFIVNGINQRKFQPYESNIDPFLRFAHIQNIQPAGWVEIPKNKCTPNDILPSKCATDVRVNWKFVHHIEKEAIAPLLVASFDLECMSSDGDFPVPIKNYQKIATDLYNIYHSMRGKQADEYDIKRALSGYMVEQFDKKLVLPKYEDEVKSLRNKLDRYLDHIVTITRGDKGTMERSFKDVFQSNFNKVSEAPEHCLAFFNRIKAGDITTTALRKSVSTWMEKCFESNERILEKQCDPEESIEILIKILFCDKDGIITTLTRFLNEVMPELKGDEIIQIGTTFHRYGEQECHRKVIFSLGTCDHIDGIEVQEFDNEEDMIVAWTELINDSDPDIITGYNIFGFDFNYIYHRAVELGCDREFCRIGRIIGQVSKYKESKLSSSALGDNLMKFVDIEGRTLIDLMKVVQRDHKLDSYKLDNVANHFMKMNKNDVTPQDIFRLFKGSSADRAIVADYCVQDCALCNKLMMKLEIVANNVGMANVCSVPLSWIFMRGQGVKIFSLVAKECKNQGFLIPVVAKPAKKKLEEVTEDELEKDEGGYEGAIVLEPKTGIYIDTPISIFDYASLYPSSMISENISHDSIVLDEKYDNLPGVKYLDVTYDLYEKVGDEKNKIGEQVCRYVQPENGEKGVIPNILMHLLKQRKLTRKKIGLQKVVMKDGVEYTGFYQKGNGVVFGLSGEKHEFSEDDVENVSDVYNNFQKAVLDGLQLAYKVTANSLYGQVGASTSPLYLKYLAASTTATGRKMIMLAKDFMEKEYKADIVYGDSVTGDTPLLIRYPSGIVDICTIETMCEKWDPYEKFAKVGDQKEQGFIHAQVWANGNWADIKRVIRHRTNKKMYRVNTFSGCVDVTEDHSLIGINGKEVRPGDLVVGQTEIKHTFPNEFEEINIPMKGFDVGNDDWTHALYPDNYKCKKCGEEFGIDMYYINQKRNNARDTQCRMCIKKRDCERTGREFDGKIHDKVLKYKTSEYIITKYEAWVWGFFFGDGSCGDYDCKSGGKKSWAINNSNMHFLEKAKKHLELVENPNICKFKILDTLGSSGVFKLVATGSPKYMVEKYRALFYDKDDLKKVPAIILNASHETKLWFMRGYLTADGTKREMAKGQWAFACKGKIGAQGLFYIMKSLGMRDMRVNIQPYKENTYWISNIIDMKRCKKNINKVMKIQELSNTGNIESNDIGKFVYDIETEDGVFQGGVGEVLLKNTDSLFLTFPNELNGLYGEEALKKTLEISLEASDKIKPLLKKPHDLEYEKIFFPMILFSKKRYCANKYEHDVNKFKQISMGIVLKRRDNANIVKKIYGGIIDIILNKHDIKESIRFLSKSLQDLIAGEYPLEDFIITKTLKGHYKDPSKIAHKVLAERIKERSPGNAPQANDRIPFAYIDVKDQKVLQGERIEHPDYIKEKNLKLDYAFYITNQLQNPVLQLYALILEQLDGYRKPADHWTEMKTKLEKEGKSQKFVREKIADLREEEARKLLLEETLVKIKLGRTGQKQITDFFKLH